MNESLPTTSVNFVCARECVSRAAVIGCLTYPTAFVFCVCTAVKIERRNKMVFSCTNLFSIAGRKFVYQLHTTGRKDQAVYFAVITLLSHRSKSGLPAIRTRSASS